MNKQTTISLIIIILGLAGLVWWSKSVDRATVSDNEFGGSHPAIAENGQGVLTAPETFYDFGQISMKNGNVSKIFKVTNSGTANVNLASVSTSCMCTAAYILRENGDKLGPFGMPGHGGTGGMPGHGDGKAGEIIPAGDSRGIEVVYDPNAHGPAGVGRINRFIYLEDADGNKLQFEIKANVTP